MRDFGTDLQRSLKEFRQKAAPLLLGKEQANYLRSLIRADAANVGAAILMMIDTDEAEQGITRTVLETILAHPRAMAGIPCCELACEIMLGYLDQTVATSGTPSKIEDSFGGDLIHALYIDCVDVWRGDGRFCELLRQRLPSRRSKIQPSLYKLPDHIMSLGSARN
jgi:hypothetical protein